MGSYLGRRLAAVVFAFFGVTIGTFGMLHLAPGDPVYLLVGASEETGMVSAETLRDIRARYGLDESLPSQYLHFLQGLTRGDLGQSIFQRRPVLSVIWDQFPNTAQLAVAALIISLAIGVTLGVAAAYRHNSWFDSISMTVALIGVSMPGYWLGVLLILLFAVGLGVLPTSGSSSPIQLILPALTLGLGHGAILARLTRSSMLEVLNQEYVTTARSKGLRERSVLFRHAFRNAVIPVVTIAGLQFGHVLAGSVFIEVVFARQGIGSTLVTAILQRDFPLAQGVVLFTAAFYVLSNFLVDGLYLVLDPRIRYE